MREYSRKRMMWKIWGDRKLKQDEETTEVNVLEDHPWLEMPEDSIDEVIRFSLDEIRVG